MGHYAGSVSRFAAYLIDVAVSAGLFALGLAATSLVAQVVTGHQVSWSRANIVVAVMFAAWEFFYFGYSWAVSGRTFGMAALGVQVVRADGQALASRYHPPRVKHRVPAPAIVDLRCDPSAPLARAT